MVVSSGFNPELGTDNNANHPLSTDGDSVYVKDIDTTNSSIGDFSGSITDLFDDTRSVISSDTDNPSFTVELLRPIHNQEITFSTASGNFSNVKIIAKDTAGNTLETIDDSANNTKYTANSYYFTSIDKWCTIVVSFTTTDTVTVGYACIQKSEHRISHLHALKPDGTVTAIDATAGGNLKISLEELESGISSNSNAQLNVTQYLSNGNEGIAYADSPAIDAFGRLRVSNPTTLFDSKNIYDDPDLASTVENQPLLYDNQETSGSGTGTNFSANESLQDLTVSNTTAGTRVRQTKMRFNYQPGKSQLIIMTFNMKGTASGITKREGIFDDNNGLFLEFDGTTVNFVRRTKASGSVVNNKVAQASWNLDTMDGNGASGITLDWDKTQIMYIDYEWLGVGRVRMGFVIDGKIYYAHEFLNTNVLDVVYMQTPNLPLRSEISNDGTGAADSLEQICSTVISEGGSQDLGIMRYASTNGTHIDANTENTIYAILGMRLKSAYLGATVKLISAYIAEATGSKELEVMFILNPTVAGTFTYADETNSAIQIARGASTNTVTGGTKLFGGFMSSATRGGVAGSALENALRLGSLIDGTPDELVLCIRPIAGSINTDVEGSITWRELV